ncbi:MAG: DNA polymerase domain-containing protein [Candidatus Aenigmatarchaeota archaeon]
MDATFQLLDCDYILINNSPIIRLFGRTIENKSICLFYSGHFPYFYVLPKDGEEQELIDFLKQKFLDQIKNIEWTEKFLPIGYQKDKTKLLKITLFDPSKTPKIRDDIIQCGLAKEVFEADILYKYRFMADANLSGMKWYKVLGKTTTTNSVKTDIKVEVRTIEEAVDYGNNLKILSLDIEMIHDKDEFPDPRKNPIAIISLVFYPEYEGKKSLILITKRLPHNNDVLSFNSEKEMLEEFIRIINDFDPDLIIGYNINNFDLPYILQRLTVNKLSKTIGRCNTKPAISKKLQTRNKNNIPGRVVVDVYELVKRLLEKETQMSLSFSKASRLKRYGLGDVSKQLLGEGKLELSHSEISKYWSGGLEDVQYLIDYARKDAELTMRLLLEKNLLDRYIEITKLSGLLLQDVLDGGESIRIENILLREFNKEDFVIPLKPSSSERMRREEERIAKGFKGALVLEPAVGLHTTPIVYLDFKSMYPSIFIYYNICPTTLVIEKFDGETYKTPYGAEFVSKKIRLGIVPRIVERLIKERDEVKKMMKLTKDEDEKRSLDAKQYALKILHNAFYGYTGYIRARFYILDIANAITSCGRDWIQRTKEIVERDSKFKVIYGDTDSIMVKVPTDSIEEAFLFGRELEEKVNKEMSGMVQMKIENVFKTFLILAKKRYAGLAVEKIDGEYRETIVMKGIETVRRDWCNLASITLYEILDILLKEQNPKKAVQYIKNVINKLEQNQIPIEDLIITKSLSKSLKEYKGIQPHVELVKKIRKRSPTASPGLGDRIGYVIVQGPQLLSERAEDPEYVKEKGLKIDSRYYIENQLLPPLERVFEAIGISKSELLGIGKQMMLLDAIKNNAKKTEGKILESFEEMVCIKCGETFHRIPLIGKCDCGGEILFSSKNELARFVKL